MIIRTGLKKDIAKTIAIDCRKSGPLAKEI